MAEERARYLGSSWSLQSEMHTSQEDPQLSGNEHYGESLWLQSEALPRVYVNILGTYMTLLPLCWIHWASHVEAVLEPSANLTNRAFIFKHF